MPLLCEHRDGRMVLIDADVSVDVSWSLLFFRRTDNGAISYREKRRGRNREKDTKRCTAVVDNKPFRKLAGQFPISTKLRVSRVSCFPNIPERSAVSQVINDNRTINFAEIKHSGKEIPYR